VAVAVRLKLVSQALAVALVAGLLGLLVWKLARGSQHVNAGQQAPSFTLRRIGAPGTLSLASLRGKAVVLNFWASWCIPCKQEAALLESASRRWLSRGVVVLGVDSEDFTSDARAFMRRHGVTYPVVHDGQGSSAERYGVSAFPETFFVGRNGHVVLHVPGQIVSRTQLDHGIRKALLS
jgi:cytochrome c biogenesis protein CcmG, thiol:disulfide interchange protein DsbE